MDADTYRVAQARLSAQSAATAIALWPILTSDDMQKTVPTWLTLLLRLIGRDRRKSAALASAYMTSYRLDEVGDADFRAPAVMDFNEQQIVTSMLVTGPYSLARVAREGPISPPQARKIMESNARAVMRHVSNGGRDVIDHVIQNDPQVRGYVRVTDGQPCYFCAMLASRGGVYDSQSFADSDPRFFGPGNAKVHDGCGCITMPLYGSDRVPSLNKELSDLWASSTGGTSGKGAIRAFRRAYENR